ncbi:hypothetical protein O185_19735 [Photorhabdus temperata J3]|uniref:Uncharacterized protein n=1 Tax=Photorhabdus temperata J3 TaxID=1389415 RepID=U7QYB7_PHOTE|nr:hypothetical protein O185_19735 [Photorhabdus temperata J3]
MGARRVDTDFLAGNSNSNCFQPGNNSAPVIAVCLY